MGVSSRTAPTPPPLPSSRSTSRFPRLQIRGGGSRHDGERSKRGEGGGGRKEKTREGEEKEGEGRGKRRERGKRRKKLMRIPKLWDVEVAAADEKEVDDENEECWQNMKVSVTSS